MKVTKTLVAIAIAAASTGVLADGFNGFYAGVGVGAVGADTKLNLGPFSATVGETTTVGVLDVGYSLPINSTKFGVALGATYDLNETKSGELETHGLERRTARHGLKGELQGKDHYSVYVQPFYMLTQDSAVFAKIGYHSMKGELLLNGQSSESMNLNGVGVGLGARVFATKNIFIQAEAGWVDYGSKTKGEVDVKVRSTNGTISVGYSF